MNSSVNKTDKELSCVCSRWGADDGVNHFGNFNIANSRKIGAGEWYGVVPFYSILPETQIVGPN